MIFAGGGLGLAAAGQGILCIGSMALVVAIAFAVVGINFARSTNKSTRRLGVCILLMSCSLPFLCCFSFQDIPGRSELRMKIHEGMSEEEVIHAIGQPNSRETGFWIYHNDLWGLSILSVNFRDDGRVKNTFSGD
jgi:hypothetical protein